MEKNLLFITARLPWPVDGGRKMSLNYYCRGLHEKFGYDVYLYCFLEDGQKYDGNCPDYIKDVFIAEDINIGDKVCNLLFKTFTGTAWPVQCSLYYNNRNLKKIKEICNQIKPKVVFTEMIRTATYFKAFAGDGVLAIANLDDLLSKRYLRQAQTIRSKANIAGAYAERLPKLINKIIVNPIIKNTFLKFESKRCQKWERKYYELYDYSMFTSPIEVNEMNKAMHADKAITLSVGIDYDLFAREIPGLKKEKNTLSYVGNFKVAANSDTLKMICEEVLPFLKHDYKLYVIGSCPDELKAKYSSSRIVFTGRVKDLAENIRKTEIFLSPISYGTGIKTKIVEAMSMGMPIVTNNVGVEGIAANSGKEIIIADEYKDIAEAVDELFENPIKREQIGKLAQEFAYKNFRWEVVYKSFERVGL